MVTYGSCWMLWIVVIPVGAGPIEGWWPASLDGSQSGAGWAITSSEGLVESYGFSDWQLAVGRLEHIHHIFPPFTKLEKLIIWCSMLYDICMTFLPVDSCLFRFMEFLKSNLAKIIRGSPAPPVPGSGRWSHWSSQWPATEGKAWPGGPDDPRVISAVDERGMKSLPWWTEHLLKMIL